MKKLTTTFLTAFFLSGCSTFIYEPHTERLISPAQSQVVHSQNKAEGLKLTQPITIGGSIEFDGNVMIVVDKYMSALGLPCLSLEPTNPTNKGSIRRSSLSNTKVCQKGAEWIVVQGLARISEGAM